MRAAVRAQNACREGGGGSLQTAAGYRVIPCGFSVAFLTHDSGALRGMEESFNYLGQESTKIIQRRAFFQDNCKEVCQ